MTGSGLARQGYTAQAGRYAETALTFDALRPHDPFFPAGSPERAWIEAHGEAIRAEQNATAAAGLRVMNHIDFPILPRKVLEAYAATMCRNASASPCEASFASESPLDCVRLPPLGLSVSFLSAQTNQPPHTPML